MIECGTYCGTSCGTYPKKPCKNRHTPLTAEPAEPFPTHFTVTCKYMKKMSKSGICRFRRFRLGGAFALLDEMCENRFRTER